MGRVGAPLSVFMRLPSFVLTANRGRRSLKKPGLPQPTTTMSKYDSHASFFILPVRLLQAEASSRTRNRDNVQFSDTMPCRNTRVAARTPLCQHYRNITSTHDETDMADMASAQLQCSVPVPQQSIGCRSACSERQTSKTAIFLTI